MTETENVVESTNGDRLQFLYLNLVGHVVNVHGVDGSITEGLFVSRTDDDAAVPAILLSKTRNRRSVVCNAEEITELSEMMLVPLSDVVFVSAAGVRVEAAAAGRVGHYRSTALEMNWADLPPEEEKGMSGNLEEEEREWVPGKWNQFETNEKKFGVKSSYKEEHYTTVLDKTKFTKEQHEQADRVARDIERSQTRGTQHRIERGEEVEGDEGTLYSDVPRTEPVPQTVDAPSVTAIRRGAAGSSTSNPPCPPSIEGCAEPVPGGSIGTSKTQRGHRLLDTALVLRIGSVLDGRGDTRRCPPDWPGDGDFYDVEDCDYKRLVDEFVVSSATTSNKQMPHHHPHSHPHHVAQQQPQQTSAPHVLAAQQQQQQQQHHHHVHSHHHTHRQAHHQYHNHYQPLHQYFAHEQGTVHPPGYGPPATAPTHHNHSRAATVGSTRGGPTSASNAPPISQYRYGHSSSSGGGSGGKTMQPQQPVPAALASYPSPTFGIDEAHAPHPRGGGTARGGVHSRGSSGSGPRYNTAAEDQF